MYHAGECSQFPCWDQYDDDSGQGAPFQGNSQFPCWDQSKNYPELLQLAPSIELSIPLLGSVRISR